MRTADFQKQQHVVNIGKMGSIVAGVGVSSKQSTTNKTPKFLLSPRTNSLAASNYNNSLGGPEDGSTEY